MIQHQISEKIVVICFQNFSSDLDQYITLLYFINNISSDLDQYITLLYFITNISKDLLGYWSYVALSRVKRQHSILFENSVNCDTYIYEYPHTGCPAKHDSW